MKIINLNPDTEIGASAPVEGEIRHVRAGRCDRVDAGSAVAVVPDAHDLCLAGLPDDDGIEPERRCRR